MKTMDHLRKAIEIAGGQSALARRIGRRQSHIWTWLNRDRKVPAEYCPSIERVTRGAVRCEDLRPDVEWGVVRGDTDKAERNAADARPPADGEAA